MWSGATLHMPCVPLACRSNVRDTGNGTAFLVPGGELADRLGRKRVFLSGRYGQVGTGDRRPILGVYLPALLTGRVCLPDLADGR